MLRFLPTGGAHRTARGGGGEDRGDRRAGHLLPGRTPRIPLRAAGAAAGLHRLRYRGRATSRAALRRSEPRRLSSVDGRPETAGGAELAARDRDCHRELGLLRGLFFGEFGAQEGWIPIGTALRVGLRTPSAAG